MWLCFNDGFFSAVEDYSGNEIVLRSRRREHLEQAFPEKTIFANAGTDYAYRIYLTKQELAEYVTNKIMNIDYHNFKNSVHDTSLHDLYANFWSLHYKYQR